MQQAQAGKGTTFIKLGDQRTGENNAEYGRYTTLVKDPKLKMIYIQGYQAGESKHSAVTCPYREGDFVAMLAWMTGYTDACMDWLAEL
jgi:ribosome modulation factor